MLIFVFFFSSRRRHTRYWRDWSSDVCSSDLGKLAKFLKKQNERVLLVAADVYRPAAIKQLQVLGEQVEVPVYAEEGHQEDRKSTRLNSSHANISYAVFCLKKKTLTMIATAHVSTP